MEVLQNPYIYDNLAKTSVGISWDFTLEIKYFLLIIYIVHILKTFYIIRPLLLIAYTITVADVFVTIVIMSFTLIRHDDPAEFSVEVLQDPILDWVLLDIIKYFLLIIYITKLLRTFYSSSPPLSLLQMFLSQLSSWFLLLAYVMTLSRLV